jgi:hypothetical protein
MPQAVNPQLSDTDANLLLLLLLLLLPFIVRLPGGVLERRGVALGGHSAWIPHENALHYNHVTSTGHRPNRFGDKHTLRHERGCFN